MNYLVDTSKLRETLHQREVIAGGTAGFAQSVSIITDWAVAEGRRYGAELIEVMHEEEELYGRGEAVRRQIIRQMLRGPEDTSSGRGNDLNRAFFDGFRRAIDDADLF